jgi:hypothetical protein
MLRRSNCRRTSSKIHQCAESDSGGRISSTILWMLEGLSPDKIGERCAIGRDRVGESSRNLRFVFWEKLRALHPTNSSVTIDQSQEEYSIGKYIYRPSSCEEMRRLWRVGPTDWMNEVKGRISPSLTSSALNDDKSR